MDRTDEKSIKVAEFNPKVCDYWLMSGAIGFAVSIIGIPLLLLWFPVGRIFTKRYLDSMHCELTKRSLSVKKGIFTRTEKTIPLEKITDMGMVQGPIMRHLGLHKLTVETAGQSGPGALISLTGIADAPGFRQAVLMQRDALRGKSISQPAESKSVDQEGVYEILDDIRSSLQRLEKHFLDKN